MTLLIEIRGGMSLDGAFPALRVGEAYYGRVTASGGTPFYTYQIIKGGLPDGLTLDTITGEVTGTPTSNKMAAITVRATDLQGMSVEQVFVIPGAELQTYNEYIGLVGHWPCNETGGLVLHDVSGNGHHGVVTNDPDVKFQNGFIYNLSGVSNAATVDMGSAMPKGEHWAFSAVGMRDGGNTFWPTLIATGQQSVSEPADPGIYANDPNWNARALYGDAGTVGSNKPSTVLSHVLLTRDGDVERFFVNGVLADQKTLSSWNTITNTLHILGEAYSHGSSSSITGHLRDAMLFNKSISADQAALLYAASGV